LLAERLCKDGVDIILDEWEIGPGDDVTSFMEASLSASQRVLIICTDEYIRKANILKGGVGYERMIITAEIAQGLKTRKFIPILRKVRKKSLPKFLGPRIYVDLQKDELDEDQYEILLRELLGVRKHKKPPVGRSRYATVTNNFIKKGANMSGDIPTRKVVKTSKGEREEKTTEAPAAWNFHWHYRVHEYCGCKLYLIFVRFANRSIFMKDSIFSNLRDANIHDYMIFHLFSFWDLLIRAWANDEMVEDLRNLFARNPELHKDRQPDFHKVRNLTQFSEIESYAESAEVDKILKETGLAVLEDVQKKGEKSGYFKKIKNAGLILDERVGFDQEQIQFYITIRSMNPLENADMERLKRVVRDEGRIKNRSIYATDWSSTRAIFKGQAADYYDIGHFLAAITEELDSKEVVTSTMLVANREVHKSIGVMVHRDAYTNDG